MYICILVFCVNNKFRVVIIRYLFVHSLCQVKLSSVVRVSLVAMVSFNES